MATLALASPAFAGTVCTDPHIPSRYVFDPPVPPTIVELSPSGITALCGHLMKRQDRGILACTDSATIIYMTAGRYLTNMGLSDVDQRCLLKHEIAHINGWPADHPRR